MIYGDKYPDEDISFTILESNMSEEPDSQLIMGNNTFYIWVYGSEGNHPHFHIIGNRLKSCIMLKYPKYFIHKDYKDTLKSKYCKLLDNWMREIGSDGISNWDRLVIKWNTNNPLKTQQIPVGTIQPDYSIIYPYGYFTKNNK